MLTSEQKVYIEEYQKDLVELTLIRNKIERDLAINFLVEKWKPHLGFGKKDIIQHIILASEPEDNSEIKTRYSLKEIMELQNTMPDWIVPNLIHAGGGLWILAGSPKAGKTLVGGYSLAYSVGISGDFLGNPCATGKVLFFECEESERSIGRRFKDRGVDGFNPLLQKAIEEDRIVIIKDWNIEDIIGLRRLIREIRPELVIFDSLRAITSSVDVSENSSDFSKYIYTLQKTLIMESVSGLLIHHNKKNAQSQGLEGMSGSLSIAGASDGVILLYKSTEEQGHCVELKTVPRDGTPIHYLLKDTKDPETGYKTFTKIKEFGIDPSVIKIEKRILRYLSKLIDSNGNISLADKYEIAENISEDPRNPNFNLALDRLEESAQISEEKFLVNKEVVSKYAIPYSSPWRKLGCSAVGNYPEFEAAEELLLCDSKEKVETLISSWEVKGQDFKNKVWSILNDAEKTRVFKALNPPKYTEGTWVRDESQNPHQIKELKYENTTGWTYMVVGKNSPFKEDELSLDVDYAVQNEEF